MCFYTLLSTENKDGLNMESQTLWEKNVPYEKDTHAVFAGGFCPWSSNAFTQARALLLGGNLSHKLKDMKIIPLRSSETSFFKFRVIMSTPYINLIPKYLISDHAKTYHFHNMCFYIQGL